MTRLRNRKPRILYVMHVDWHWIKQRPHFLAEELSSEFDVLISYPRANARSHLVKNRTFLTRVPMFQLPFSRFGFVTFLNQCIRGAYIWLLMLIYRPQVLWVSFPTVIPHAILRGLGRVLVVYDCMDDASEFTSLEKKKIDTLQREQRVLERAELVFVSSQHLYEKVSKKRYGLDAPVLIRNAFNGQKYVAPSASTVVSTPAGPFRVLFFGAIGDHLDFDMLLGCLENCETIEFHFIGPVMVQTPKHPRLYFHGRAEHSLLAELMRPYDCFIMPFKVNELIRGVDPVKLYEYINFGKNIICPFYPEIERFSNFVFFYKNMSDLASLIRSLHGDNRLKYSNEQRDMFLRDNTWKSRGDAIISKLQGKLSAIALEG